MPILPPLCPLFGLLSGGGSDAGPALPIEDLRRIVHGHMEDRIIAHYPRVAPLPIERDHRVPVQGGTITIRFYAPESAGKLLPCHVYFHGGGFWLGTIDHFDPLCRAISHDAGCAVAAVAYRLAPEYRFPTPLEDGWSALTWLVANAASLGIDPAQLSIGGMSAGGNIAAALTLLCRERNGPELALQVLDVPVLDLSDHSPLHLPDEGVSLPSGKDVYCMHYLNEPLDASDPLASPLLAPDLAGLPPALVMGAQYDPLAREARAYAVRLEAAGVPVHFHEWAGQLHGTQPMAALIPEQAAAYRSLIASSLKAVFG